MSSIGFYRYKRDDLNAGNYTVTLNINAVPTYTKKLVIKPFCEKQILLKYLDKNGQFRFYPFNKFYEGRINSDSLGNIDTIVYDIFTAQSNVKQIGYESRKQISLTAESVSSDELVLLSDIYDSPQVFMKVGLNDSLADWIKVEVINSDSIYKERKKNTSVVNITIQLPENYNIKLI